jgi:hypothetical protein
MAVVKVAKIDRSERSHSDRKLPDAPRKIMVQTEDKGEFKEMDVSKLPAFRGQHGWLFYSDRHSYRPIIKGEYKGNYKQWPLE